MKISEIRLNPKNPRSIKDNMFVKLVDSIREFPKMMDLRPIIIDNDGMILGGNMRYQALKEIGYKEIPNNWVKKASELTEEEIKRFIIVDNIQHGKWDFDLLANEWDIEKLEDWGMDIDFKQEIDEDEDEYEIPAEIETDIKYGDLFQIGNHRLLCGDATKIEDVEKLMNNEKADMVFTDPPYEIESSDIYSLIKRISNNTNVLIWASDKQFPYIFNSDIGEFKRLYIIDTNIASPTNNDVYINHISLLRFKIGNSTKFQNLYNGGRSIIKTDYRNNLKEEKFGHKHQKSLSILGLFIKYWSIEKQIVIDLFGGSGSIMAACEQLDRKCYMMEIEPRFCQIILDRMKKCYNLVSNKL